MKQVGPNRLGDHFVNVIPPAFCDEFCLTVAGHSDNFWLRVTFIDLPQRLRCTVSIHYRHGQVHEDEAISVAVFESVASFLYAVLAVISCIYQLGNALKLFHRFDQHFDPDLVEDLVVDDENSPLQLTRVNEIAGLNSLDD